jgi:predicted transcriptional regulator
MLGCEELLNNLLQLTTFTDGYSGIPAFCFQGENAGNQWRAIVCDDCYIVCSSIDGFCLLFDIFKRFLTPNEQFFSYFMT